MLLRWLRRVAAAIGFTFLVVTCTPLVFWWATAFAGPWNDPSGDVLVVLTGSMLDDRTVGISSYWRGVYAARAFHQGGFREVVISGGGPESTPIAAPLKTFIVALGVPADVIRLETASRSTRDSALELARLVSAEPARYRGRLVLLTSDYHMLRAHRALRRAGVTLAPRPIPDARKRYGGFSQRWSVFLELCGESAKIAYYWARGWL